MRTHLFGRHHDSLAGRRDESFVCILDGPVCELIVYIIELASGWMDDDGEVFRLVAVEISHDKSGVTAALAALRNQIISENALECFLHLRCRGWRQLGWWNG